MTDSRKNKLRQLMRRYLDRTASEKERKSLLHWVSSSRPEEVDELWNEVWQETDDSMRIDELEWNSLLKEVSDRRTNEKSFKIGSFVRWVAAAAIFTGLIFASKWLWLDESDLIYETGYGETMKIVLEDGTQVDLNADSRLVWKKDWKDMEQREVYLEGEAYFDVAHIDISGDHSGRMPFDVHTSDVTIHVMGTAFNATSRRGKTEVLLDEGLVELRLKRSRRSDEPDIGRENEPEAGASEDEDILADEMSHILRMTPGDWISFSSEEDILVKKNKDDLEKTVEWKDGTLSYQDVEFQVMLENLEDIYGKSFEVVDPELLERRVKIGIPYKSWITVKEMMEWMLKIEVKEINDTRVQIKKGE